MKKLKLLIVVLLGMFLIPSVVSAAGNISVSTGSLNITKGGSASFKITASNAAGKVNISSSNTGVATVSTSSVFLDNESTTIKVSSKAVGSAVITVYVEDATTYDDENLSGKSYSINVNVKEPVILASNNTLKEISVDGYDLTKIDDNNYELMVNNEVESIVINATAEDEKARVEGVGEHQLAIGLNYFEVSIIAENGSRNNITIKVTRKDGYYLEDLETVINKEKDTTILLTEDSKITSDHLETIKKSKKTVTFNYVNEDKTVVYSWIIDGKELNKTSDISTKISFSSGNVNDIGKASNYAEGKYINFAHSGDLPKSTKVKLFVGDKFSNGDLVNVYYYDKDTKELDSIHDGIQVQEGYITFDIEHCSEYFVTRANIGVSVSGSKGVNVFLIISIVELVVIIGVIVFFVVKIKSMNKVEAPVVETTPVASVPIQPTTPVVETVAQQETPVVSVQQPVVQPDNTFGNSSQNL